MFKTGFPFEPFEGYKNKPREDLFALKEKSGHGKKLWPLGYLLQIAQPGPHVWIFCAKKHQRGFSHLNPLANGQAVIFLTGLLELFISESSIIT